MVEAVGTEVGDVEVGIAIVVVIGGDCAHAPTLVIGMGGGSLVDKSGFAVVLVERVAGCRIGCEAFEC